MLTIKLAQKATRNLAQPADRPAARFAGRKRLREATPLAVAVLPIAMSACVQIAKAPKLMLGGSLEAF